MGFAIKPRYSGFHITFENGVTVSVQFGAGAYGNHAHEVCSKDEWYGRKEIESSRAEVAIFNKAGWLTDEFLDGAGDVLGYLTPLGVLEALNWAAQRKGGE